METKEIIVNGIVSIVIISMLAFWYIQYKDLQGLLLAESYRLENKILKEQNKELNFQIHTLEFENADLKLKISTSNNTNTHLALGDYGVEIRFRDIFTYTQQKCAYNHCFTNRLHDGDICDYELRNGQVYDIISQEVVC